MYICKYLHAGHISPYYEADSLVKLFQNLTAVQALLRGPLVEAT